MSGELDDALRDVRSALLAHAGGLDLVAAPDGPHDAVRVRFTGACTGCPARPVTLAATVQPVLAAHGFPHVVADGVRLDGEAADKLAVWFEGGRRLRPA